MAHFAFHPNPSPHQFDQLAQIANPNPVPPNRRVVDASA